MLIILACLPAASRTAPQKATSLEHLRCEAQIISYSEWPKVQNPEWKIELASANGGRLVYFGSDHSDDPKHPQFEDIDLHWVKVKPTVAFYEGPDRGIAASRAETIRKFGESGYVRFLSKAAGIEAKRLNPPPDEYLAHLLERFPSDQVSLFLLLGEAARLREGKGASLPDVEIGVKALFKMTSAIPGSEGLIRDIPSLEAAYRRYWKEPADWRKAPKRWFTPVDDPKETGGIFTNVINRASSEFRDRYMVRVLSEAVLSGERAFAVVGRNHVPMQAPALRCLIQQEDSRRVSVEMRSGGLSDGSLSPLWLEAIRERNEPQRLSAFTKVKRPLSQVERRWLEFIAAQVPSWAEQAASLAKPFQGIPIPARIDLLIGNRGGEDGFTYSSATICLDLSRWSHLYGEPSDPDRVRRILSREYTHLLVRSWREKNSQKVKLDTPLNRALWTLFNEGFGHYRSLSDRWLPKGGRLPDNAAETLRRLEPVLVERLVALKSASPNDKLTLTGRLASGSLQKKWGALPVALWLALEADGNDTKLQPWVDAGPDGILDLATKHLPAALSARLKRELAAEVSAND